MGFELMSLVYCSDMWKHASSEKTEFLARVKHADTETSLISEKNDHVLGNRCSLSRARGR